MIYFFLVLTILLGIAFAFTFFTFDAKFKSQKKKLNLLNNQYNTLRKNALIEKSIFKDLNLKYSQSQFSYGVTTSNIKVYYLPIEGYKTVVEINSPLEISVLEQCLNNNDLWFYVDLKLKDNINSRGWIKRNDFSILREKYNPINDNLLN